MHLKKLKVAQINKANEHGLHNDGGGLFVV